MVSQKPVLAKISPPRVSKIHSRCHLANQWQAGEVSLVWLSAPAGAGKTTLVTDYLASTSTPAIWYQLDAGDTDPATIFHYLSQAAEG